jgi:hypothetical protein
MHVFCSPHVACLLPVSSFFPSSVVLDTLGFAFRALVDCYGLAMQHAICMSISNTVNEIVVVLQAVDQKERALWEKGAVWEPPPISVTLRSLPLFADLPDSLFQEIILEVRSHHSVSEHAAPLTTRMLDCANGLACLFSTLSGHQHLQRAYCLAALTYSHVLCYV